MQTEVVDDVIKLVQEHQWHLLSACLRLELSDSLVSALHTLQKALGEPNAFSHQGAVGVQLCYYV